MELRKNRCPICGRETDRGTYCSERCVKDDEKENRVYREIFQNANIDNDCQYNEDF